jgi:DNA-directed RNA polymerase specialized sigma24 family protein
MDGNNATEQAAAEFDDTEIKCLLLGDENDRQKAGDELFQSFNHRLMGKLREFFWLSEDEKGSVIHDTILAVLKLAEEATLDVERPLVGLLLRICRFKAIDLSRRKRRKAGWDGESGKDEELTEDIAEALVDTKVGLAWKHATSNEDAPAIRKEFLTFIQSLPAQQKLVGGILADNLAFNLSQEEIASTIYESTGKTVSKIAIKGALSQIRQKFKAVLKRKYPELPV